MSAARTWDLFCKVIDNYGDIGVCWRLACELAARGQQVRLWVDDASALAWMAPQGCPGVQLRAWTATSPQLGSDLPGEVLVEAFGCDIDPAWAASAPRPPVWINLEYLSAEPYVLRSHGLSSPLLSGPAAGMAKQFFYPGFELGTGGLLREADLMQSQARFDANSWLTAQGLHDTDAAPFDQTISLFCYEPPALGEWLAQLARGPLRTRLLVTAGRAAAAVQACLEQHFMHQKGLQTNRISREQLSISEHLTLHYLPPLTQQNYDHLLWSCDFNCVRGEDSLVRALWAGKPFVWHIYPQSDGAHAAKLEAFLQRIGADAPLHSFHQVWNGLSAAPLPPMQTQPWQRVATAARASLLTQTDLTSQLLAMVHQKLNISGGV